MWGSVHDSVRNCILVWNKYVRKRPRLGHTKLSPLLLETVLRRLVLCREHDIRIAGPQSSGEKEVPGCLFWYYGNSPPPDVRWPY
ncbi:hypothetical protein EMPG_09530 [Blastomyces silverae]|uniref:Uncharacterized protein n=1 Tax=Blastomyces silverae TaxID=2060906 RepID=A0A0H1BM46_9EURO|nr:hypothetical protein EMPG_09530 [Blastomyces silverae]